MEPTVPHRTPTWSEPLADGRVRCTLCPRYCQLREGQRGFCFVRQARDGRVELTSYGRASGFCIDPIEKKPLNHFYPGTSVLSLGTAGCNLGCRFCQNWDISKARQGDRLNESASPEAIARAAREHDCKSVAFTYNDPVIFAEYAIDCAHAARDVGVEPVAVSAGYVTAHARESLYGAMSAVNIDLKAFTEAFYERQCYGKLAPVLETLEWIARESSTWLEVTTLLIGDLNDSDAELAALSEWFVEHLGPDVPLHFSAFHPDYKMTDRARTPASTLLRARDIARRSGITHVYVGNVLDPAAQSTYCSHCGETLIERRGYDLGQFRVDARGGCASCGAPLPGRFAEAPGTWGSRRRRLSIATD